MGFRYHEREYISKTPIRHLNNTIWTEGSPDFFKVLLTDQSFAKSLVSPRSDILEDEELPSKCFCRYGVFDLETYKLLLPVQCPRHQSASLESRLCSAKTTLKRDGSADVAKFLLQPEWSISPRAICTENPLTLLIARRLPVSVCDALVRTTRVEVYLCDVQVNTRQLGEKLESLFQFAIDVIQHTPDVHSTYPLLTSGRDTALTIGLFRTLKYLSKRNVVGKARVTNILHEVLVVWLRMLREADIDLNAYGKNEHQLLVNSKICQERLITHSVDHPFSVFRIVGITYGSQPEDWEIFWNEPSDQFAGHFWQLVEDPQLHIPGSWVNDDDYVCYSDSDDD